MSTDDSRELVIAAFCSHSRRRHDSSGLGLLLSIWLDLPRPRVSITADRHYRITCASKADAVALCEPFGGMVRGKSVYGYIGDLTS